MQFNLSEAKLINGERLKALRENNKLSAQDLADELGIGVAQVFRYEAEKTDPTTGTLLKIADFFHVSTDYLLGRTDFPNEEGINFMPNAFGFDEVTLLSAWRRGDLIQLMMFIFERVKNDKLIDLKAMYRQSSDMPEDFNFDFPDDSST